MWFWIWFALVVGALVAHGLVLWWLWRRGANLYRVLESGVERLEDAMGADHIDEFSQPRPVVALGDTRAAREYREERVVARLERRDRRYDRYRLRWRSWSEFNS